VLFLFLTRHDSALFVIDPRFGIELSLELLHSVLDDILRDLAIGVVEITKHPHPCHAGRHACRPFSLFHEFDAEPAFFNISLFLDDPHIVGTGHNAVLAADAFVFVNQDDAILPLVRGSGGTDLHTGGIVTMLALNREEFAAVIRKRPVFALFKVVISLFLLKAILVMAGHPAGMTSHTFRFIDDHPVSSHGFLLSFFGMSSRTCFGSY
jgi:hypothetical protein